MYVHWREREHEAADEAAAADSNVMAALTQCGLVKFFLNLSLRPGKNIAEFFEKIRVNLNLFGGAIRSDEDILHDARVSGDIDRYRFSDSHHISLSINILCSQEVNGTRLISRHGDSEFSCLDSV
jgi:hypothetical protein